MSMNPNPTVLIDGGCVVTVDEQDTVIPDGFVLIRDGAIAAVGPSAAAPSTVVDEYVDARGSVVVPGFVNTHQHPWFCLFKGLAQARGENPGVTIGRLSPLSTRPDWVAGTRLGCLEMVLSGTTTFLNHWNTPTGVDDVRELLAPAAEVGIRTVFAKEIRLVPALDSQLEVAEAVHHEFHGSAAGRVTVGLVAESGHIQRDRGTSSDELVLRAHALADEWSAPISSHVASYGGYLDLVRSHGETDFDYLHRLGVLDERWVLGHAMTVRDGDIDLIAASGATVSHTPTSESTRGGGITPVHRMRQRGVRVALGSDGPMVDTTVDMVEQMKAVMLIQNQVHLSPDAVLPAEALRMATIDGARALGLADQVGSLEVGKRADLGVYPLDKISTTVWHDPVSIFVRSLHGRDVETLLIDGQVVIRNGTLASVSPDDVAEIVSEARARSDALAEHIH